MSADESRQLASQQNTEEEEEEENTHTNKREDDYAFENECTVWAIEASLFLMQCLYTL